ncbi:prephenate dehydrogenase [Micromonospora auratinigra]|uniref:Prephenate dehydrogenase n=1 Tax=Micromonospora auratinigra TaxID=261654 RepID=A0A1A8ZTP3_9ACTN|nr:prephenate dehydrogenase/arogenate dehydrogenase family protein [Micromonospora auratinigra]SBT47242.1 prephenate dehydrogenase [Micromonospora auratinigra]
MTDPPASAGDVRGVRAAVLGTGLIGGSVLLRLRDADVEVTAWDPDPETRRLGRERGLHLVDSVEAAVAGCEVVFLCGPLPTLPGTLLRVAEATDDHCVLTDVGSTKGGLADFARAHGLAARFVPGHPMAGSDRAGLHSADAALFGGASWVLCPLGSAGLTTFRRLTRLIMSVFRARVVPMSADEHDAAAALASHVPHLLARALAGAVHRADLRDAVLTLAAGSFRDGTRVAATPSDRTANMLLGNRERVLDELGRVSDFLDELAGALRAGDRAALLALTEEAGAARAALTERSLRPQRREFPVHGAGERELAYLLGLGAAGGHLTGCRVEAGTVVYTAHVPDSAH